METTTVGIEGMHCDGCAGRVKSMLEQEPGVREAEVSYPAGEARVRYNEHTVDPRKLRQVIERAGYTARSEA